MAAETSLTTKILLWFMTALTTIASFVAVQYDSRIKELREVKDLEISSLKQDNRGLRKDRDSLQKVILIRADNNYEDLKKTIGLLKVEDKNSTITITPKKK